MSDLISRSELIKELNKYCGNQRYLVSENIREIINNQPNAYSVDKVVEELESFSKLAEDRWTNGTSKYAYQEHKCWVKAIEIVKQGGVSDDVCEWKVFDNSLTDEPQWVYETTCGKYTGEEHTSKAFAYCPCCGKKIKIVGD